MIYYNFIKLQPPNILNLNCYFNEMRFYGRVDIGRMNLNFIVMMPIVNYFFLLCFKLIVIFR